MCVCMCVSDTRNMSKSQRREEGKWDLMKKIEMKEHITILASVSSLFGWMDGLSNNASSFLFWINFVWFYLSFLLSSFSSLLWYKILAPCTARVFFASFMKDLTYLSISTMLWKKRLCMCIYERERKRVQSYPFPFTSFPSLPFPVLFCSSHVISKCFLSLSLC